jgi:hypothetical protein
MSFSDYRIGFGDISPGHNGFVIPDAASWLLQIQVLSASTTQEIDAAFATFVRDGADGSQSA